MSTVFVSDAIDQERLVFGPSVHQAAGPWKSLSALYQASLIACGYGVARVVRPEIYQAPVGREICGVQPGDWHLAVKPIAHIRPFHGIPNVFVCDWPYPEVSASSHGISPFFNQARLLNQADAILCCTGFTAQALRAAGVTRVVTLPPWIPPPPGTAADRPGPSARRRFLLAADRSDVPRQLVRTVEGFAQAQSQRGDLHLTVCVQDAHASQHTVLQGVGRRGLEDAVSFVESPPSHLLDAADFMLCDSPASGLPVRLVEAMLAGVPVVTPLHSGIASILTPDAVIPIATHGAAADGEREPVARHMHLTCNPATIEGVRDAILAAASLDAPARSRMAHIARGIAERQFGMPAFQAGLADLGAFIPL